MLKVTSPHPDASTEPGLRSAEAELQWLEQALELAEAAMYEWDLATNTLLWASNAAHILGFSSNGDIADPEKLSSCILPEHRKHVRQQREALVSTDDPTVTQYCISYEMRVPGAGVIPIVESGKAVRDGSGRLLKMIGMLTPSAQRMARIEGRNNPGRVLEEDYAYPRPFIQALARQLELSPHQGAVTLISVENMPMIVNAYGHSKAEDVLQLVRDDIFSHLNPQTERLYRVQRDQFAIVSSLLDAVSCNALCKRLTHSLKQLGSKVNDGRSLHIVSGLGTAYFSEISGDTLEERSYSAVDKAYVRLKSSSIFAMGVEVPEAVYASQEASIEQMEVASFLHRAIHEERIRLAYQPVVKATTGEISHYECLLRLVNDDGTVSSAGAMIPVAERMGLIDVIDHLVLEMVVEDLLRSPDVHLAFNVSNLTTNNRDWLETFVRIIESTPEIAPRMIIEITETAAQLDMRATAYFVATVQALGCRVALDDFGSGYTSFRQLKALSCDMVKIDGSFIKDMDGSEDSQFFVRTLLEFINGFGLEAVAECVETGETAKALMDLGIHYLQGYYFGAGKVERAWLK